MFDLLYKLGPRSPNLAWHRSHLRQLSCQYLSQALKRYLSFIGLSQPEQTQSVASILLICGVCLDRPFVGVVITCCCELSKVLADIVLFWFLLLAVDWCWRFLGLICFSASVAGLPLFLISRLAFILILLGRKLEALTRCKVTNILRRDGNKVLCLYGNSRPTLNK